MRATETLRVLRRDEGKAALLASIGVRFMVDGDRSGGGFALVEHPTPARALAAPLHRHSREDEYGRRLGTRGDFCAEQGNALIFGAPRAP